MPRFNEAMDAVARRLPFGLSRIVPGNLVGFGVINGFTFAVDLTLLTIMRSGLGWPLPVSITIGYVIAFGLSFVLNRAFNFRSHAPVGPQVGIYVVVVVVNYLAWILGVGSGLAALGVDYHLARLAAGACEAVYMYAAMRWVVFRRAAGTPSPAASSGSPAAPATPGSHP
ncbi:GtrA family protein [Actinokineospora sp. UTMC 2448]|uniref:GtrA family protein n=1 Tax=Actinokineospora sp. UTMC 2448 TaxID=2268449 RepID=UPI0037C1321C